MTKTHFIHYPIRPKKLTAAFAKKEYAKLLDRLPLADTSNKPDAWIELFKDWNELKSYIGSEYARISNAFDKNMANTKLEAAKTYIREKLSPAIDEPEFLLTKAFLDSPHREDLAKHFGTQLIPIYEAALKPLDPRNTSLSIKAGTLTNKYSKLIAGAKVLINKKYVTLEQAASYLESPDRAERKAAFLASRNWFLEHRNELAKIYDELVILRTKMGQNVGFKTFTPLGYKIMGRSDYSEEEVEQFRKNTKKYFVPLLQKLSDQQTKDLGVDTLRPWDVGYHPDYTLPRGICAVATQLDKAQKIFNQLDPRLGEHFNFMRQHRLIDLENRPNKRAGAYMTNFSDEQKASILCNSTGDSSDIETLTHEMGHAFQYWESKDIEPVDLQSGTIDLAEVHSTSMEFLCLPYINEFFSAKDVAKYSYGRWIRAIRIMCYVCVVDEFQHWVYAHPSASPKMRDETWNKISDTYIPKVDYKGFEKYRSTRWYAQQHIFSVPFYYIDYGLAIMGAMQIASLASKNHRLAMKKYLELCRIGGTLSFLKAFKHAGLESPFKESTFKTLAAHTKKTLEL